MVNRHTRHRVVEILPGRLAHIGVYDGIGGDHALIHTVEGELAPVRAPEESPMDAELVLVHRPSIDEGGATVACDLSLLGL